MDKSTLIETIQSAKISDVLKKELIELVNAEAAYGPETIKKVQARLNGAAEEVIEDVANLQILAAKDEFDKQMAEVDQDIKQLNSEISKKADQVDIAETRSKLS